MTPFWHRRVCEATVLINAIILLIYLWATTGGFGFIDPPRITIGIEVVAVSAVSMIIAIVSYTLIPEKKFSFRVISAFIAYALLLGSVGSLSAQETSLNSPFLALWMLASVFSGMFGALVIGLLTIALTGYTIWSGAQGLLDSELIIRLVLAGYLPLLISFVLWHSKSSSEKTKDRVYSDLANELNQVANKSDTVIGAISDGVIAVNNQGNIELINPAALRLTGWGKQDALNLDYKSVLQLLSKDGSVLDKAKDPVFEVLSTNQPVRRDNLQLQTNSGKKINIEIVVSPIGRIGAGAIIVFRDITKEQAEEQAQAEFISTASHEMRTPVASIEGYLGLALNPATAKIDEKAREYIKKAHESAQHLGRLFQDLLDVTKAEDGRLSNNPKVIDLVQFTSDIIEGLKPKADEKGLRLFFKPVGDEVGGLKNLEPVYFVDLDADHLREVLANLVENAIKYTPKGEVIIDVKGDDSHVVVSIADSGIGIPNEDIPHLFQKFYRVDNTDTREIGGTGLGLYLCRRLVETMDGRIWVESEYKKGSTFFVELPRITHEEAQRRIEASTTDPVKPSPESVGVATPPKLDPEEQKHREEALSTPIIMNKKGSASQAQPYNPTPAKDLADPIIGNSPASQSVPPNTQSAQDQTTPQPNTKTSVASPQPAAPVSQVVPTPVSKPAPPASQSVPRPVKVPVRSEQTTTPAAPSPKAPANPVSQTPITEAPPAQKPPAVSPQPPVAQIQLQPAQPTPPVYNPPANSLQLAKNEPQPVPKQAPPIGTNQPKTTPPAPTQNPNNTTAPTQQQKT